MFRAHKGLKPNFPIYPTARLKPCPDTKRRPNLAYPYAQIPANFVGSGVSATFLSHTPSPWLHCFPMRIPFILCYQEVRYGRILFNGFSFGHAWCRATARKHGNGFFPARFFYRPDILTALGPAVGARPASVR